MPTAAEPPAGIRSPPIFGAGATGESFGPDSAVFLRSGARLSALRLLSA
jgi:hypothetical protein